MKLEVFRKLVKDAPEHLYDTAYLEVHPRHAARRADFPLCGHREIISSFQDEKKQQPP
jgi:hypothetical protein